MKRLVAILFAALLASGPALADMVATWVSIDGRQGARAGKSGHGLGDGDITTGTLDEVWTLTVQSTDAGGMHGEWCSTKVCEDLVATINSQGTFYAVDEDGVFMGTVLGDTMEICYLEPGTEFRVADCHMLAQQ
jgi:hypothetical protein